MAPPRKLPLVPLVDLNIPRFGAAATPVVAGSSGGMASMEASRSLAGKRKRDEPSPTVPSTGVAGTSEAAGVVSSAQSPLPEESPLKKAALVGDSSAMAASSPEGLAVNSPIPDEEVVAGQAVTAETEPLVLAAASTEELVVDSAGPADSAVGDVAADLGGGPAIPGGVDLFGSDPSGDSREEEGRSDPSCGQSPLIVDVPDSPWDGADSGADVRLVLEPEEPVRIHGADESHVPVPVVVEPVTLSGRCVLSTDRMKDADVAAGLAKCVLLPEDRRELERCPEGDLVAAHVALVGQAFQSSLVMREQYAARARDLEAAADIAGDAVDRADQTLHKLKVVEERCAEAEGLLAKMRAERGGLQAELGKSRASVAELTARAEAAEARAAEAVAKAEEMRHQVELARCAGPAGQSAGGPADSLFKYYTYGFEDDAARRGNLPMTPSAIKVAFLRRLAAESRRQ